MKKLVPGFLVLLVWLTGCGGAYESLEVQYPTLSTTYKLNLEIINSSEGINEKELESLRELVVFQLQKRGIVIDDNARRKLIVEIVEANKDSQALRLFLTLTIGGPFTQYSSNILGLRVFLKDQERTIELKEFQEFHESIKGWEDMKIAVARRIADAVYFARR